MNIRSFYTWHRRLGIVVGLFIIMLVITGFALNHTQGLGLDKRFVAVKWLLDWYQIEVKGSVLAYTVDDQTIVQIGDRLYKGEQEIHSSVKQLIGAIALQDTTVIALDNELMLLNKQGEILEVLSGVDGVPAAMQAIGENDPDYVYIRAARGIYRMDIIDLEWQAVSDEVINWSKPSTIEPSLYHTLEQQYRGSGLTLERVLLDIHSGRILGVWGVLLVDLAGVLLLILVITGSYMWYKRL